jgi:hypothetical protein
MVVEAEVGVGIRSVEFVATDVARWHQLAIDIAALASGDELHAAVQAAVRALQVSAEERLLALRLTLAGVGRCIGDRVEREALRAQLAASIGEASAGRAWLEKVRIKVTAPLDLPRLAERDDPIGLLIRSIESLEADPVMLQSLAESCCPISGKSSRPNCAGRQRLGPGFPRSPGRRAGPRQGAPAGGDRRRGHAMKIEQIDLKAYGHFTNRRLLLAGGAPCTSSAGRTKPARRPSGERSTAPCSASPRPPATATCTATRNCASGSPCRRGQASGWR